jgi:hypothetical protein
LALARAFAPATAVGVASADYRRGLNGWKEAPMSNAQITAIRVAGAAELKYVKREQVQVPGQEGHVLSLGESHGRNRNTVGDTFFADAETKVVEIADIRTKGVTQEGYIQLAKGADSALARWTGTAEIKGTADQPQIAFRGIWEYVQGTGRYEGIQGSGTYEGEFLDEDRYTVRWEGERLGE